MSNPNFSKSLRVHEPWERLWLPVETWEHFRGIDEEFLTDYGGKGGGWDLVEFALPGIGTLAKHADHPLLVMLGRPGAGKSDELRKAETDGLFGANAIFLDGKAFGVAQPGSYISERYKDQLDNPARLVIDGLDEILPTNPNFLAQLKSWLKARKNADGTPKHTLVISCRWADWPEGQIAELADLWVNSEVQHIVLAPLKREDAVGTLRRRLGEAGTVDFWEQLCHKRLMQMACWPQGFLSLIAEYQSSNPGQLASSYATAIGGQVRRDFMLTDSRDETGRWKDSVAGAERRGQLAGRVAAAMTASGASSFGFHDGKVPGVLSARELSSSTEIFDGERSTPVLEDFDDVVKLTNLMRQLPGGQQWKFQSQVFQEWLAARWFADKKLGIAKLKEIFGMESAEAWVVASPMRATAAWLAGFDKNFRREVLNNDPLTLLRIDGAGLPESERKKIVEALLSATDDARVVDPATRQAHLPSLRHGRLKEQLMRWLKDPNVHQSAKVLAVEMADETGLSEIAPFFWKIYPAADKRLKIHLARALGHISKDGSDLMWSDVISGKIETDDHGGLLGYALEIMVVKGRKIPVRDALRHIFPKRTFEVFGIFEMVFRQLPECMDTEDLTAVFQKIAENPHALHASPHHHYGEFNTAALRLAFENLENPNIAAALAEFWHQCLTRHVVPVRIGETSEDEAVLPELSDERRREVVSLLIAHPGFERNRGKGWVCTDYYLLNGSDFDWCLEKLRHSENEEKWRYAMLIGTMIWRVDFTPERSEAINRAWETETEMKANFPKPTDGETMSESILRNLAENNAKHEGRRNHEQNRSSQLELAFAKRMESRFGECRTAHDKGGIVWPSVFDFLTFRSSGSESGMITFYPVSTIGEDESWMIEAAARFITEAPRKHVLNHNLTLYGALALAACGERIETDEGVRHVLENEWLEALIPYLCNHGLGEAPEMVTNRQFAAWFPESFVTAFGRFVRKSYLEGETLNELRSLEETGLPCMARELEYILLSEAVQPGGFFNSIHFLAIADEAAALRVLRVLAEKNSAISDDEPDAGETAVLAAAMTLVGGRLNTEIRSRFFETKHFATAFRFAVSHLGRRDRQIDFSQWGDQALKDLAEACWRAYLEPDQHRNRGTFEFRGVTEDDEAMEFRDRISAAAWNRGIDLEMLEVAEGKNPEQALAHQHLTDWHRRENKKIRAGNGWKPLSPMEFFKWADEPNARLARNQDELMEAIILSLKRWEETLLNGHWHRLWNDQKIKLEKVVAREMADWIQGDLELQVDCEVEPILDKRADLLVRVYPSDGVSPSLQVVIEVKKLRADNSAERKTAMKTQLLDTYLKPRLADGWTHGLFVVVWTPAPGSASDSMDSLNSQSALLKRQAKELSVEPFTLRSLVLDCRYRGKTKKAKKV